jgi:hypothetical protein
MTDPAPEPLVVTVPELQAQLRVGRHTALKIAREIGIRVGKRRLVIPRIRLEAWLAGSSEPPPDEDARWPEGEEASL